MNIAEMAAQARRDAEERKQRELEAAWNALINDAKLALESVLGGGVDSHYIDYVLVNWDELNHNRIMPIGRNGAVLLFFVVEDTSGLLFAAYRDEMRNGFRHKFAVVRTCPNCARLVLGSLFNSLAELAELLERPLNLDHTCKEERSCTHTPTA